MICNPIGDPAITSPILPHGIGNISFRAKRGNATADPCNVLIQWSTDKVAWTTIDNVSITQTGYTDINKDDFVGDGFNITNNNIYLRIVNDKSVDNNILYLDDIRIEPSPTSGPNWDFSDYADGWFASYDNWNVVY